MKFSKKQVSSTGLVSVILIMGLIGLWDLHTQQPISSSVRNDTPELLVSESDVEQDPIDVDQILELRNQLNRPLTGSFLDGQDTQTEFALALQQVSGQVVTDDSSSDEDIVLPVINFDNMPIDSLISNSAILLDQAAQQIDKTDPEYAAGLRKLARKVRKKTKSESHLNE